MLLKRGRRFREKAFYIGKARNVPQRPGPASESERRRQLPKFLTKSLVSKKRTIKEIQPP